MEPFKIRSGGGAHSCKMIVEDKCEDERPKKRIDENKNSLPGLTVHEQQADSNHVNSHFHKKEDLLAMKNLDIGTYLSNLKILSHFERKTHFIPFFF